MFGKMMSKAAVQILTVDLSDQQLFLCISSPVLHKMMVYAALAGCVVQNRNNCRNGRGKGASNCGGPI
jgi:hypothetical protein